jgi:hypothetical protein
MGLAHSSSIVTNGLVFYYDMNNIKKSWNGKPVTNYYTNGHFAGGQHVTQAANGSYSNPTNTVVEMANPGDSPWCLQTTSVGGSPYTEYELYLTNTLTTNTTYCLNCWYALTPDWDGNNTVFHSRWFNPDGSEQGSLGGTSWTVDQTQVIGGITWNRVYTTFTTGATTNGAHSWYAGYPAQNTKGYRYFTNFQIEVGSTPSRFSNGTRYANSNLESSPSYPSWNTLSGSSYSGGTLTFTAGSYNSKSGWDLYKTYSGLSTGTNYTWSAFVKLGTASNLIITMNNTSAWNTGPSTVVAGLSSTDWTRVYITGTTNTGSFNLHLGASFNTEVASTVQSAGTVFIQDVRLVLSQSQTAIADMMDKNTINASSLTYNSDGTFSFSGSNSLTISANPTSFDFNSQQTIILWMTNKSTSATRRNPYNQAYAGGGTITHENDAGFNYYYGTGGGDNDPYTSLYSSFNVIQGERAMIALTRNTSTTSWYKNGVFSNSHGNPYGTVVTGTNAITIGSGYTTGFVGEIHAVQLYTRALSASEIAQNYFALSERYFGYQRMNYVASGNVTLTNNGTEEVTMFKNSDNNSWNGEVRSTEMFTAPCTIEFSKDAADGDNGASYAMIGWNTDPTADSSYTSLDYASYPYRKDNYTVYHNGNQVNFSGTWESSKRFYVVYDTDGYIRHYNGNKLLYIVNYGTGNKVYFDSSFYSVNSTFGGFSNVKVCRRSWNGYTYV